MIADLHVLGGVLENLGQGLVRLFPHHAGNLAVGFLQNFNRLALADLLIVLIENCCPRFITAFTYRSSNNKAFPKWASVSAAMSRLCQYMLSVETVSVVPAEVFGELRHVGVYREARRKAAAAHGQPLHTLNGLRQSARESA